jgi:GNAT superfamily N-acetyltransferase
MKRGARPEGAESAAAGITYRLGADVDVSRISEVYASVGWWKPGSTLARLEAALTGSAAVASAWAGETAIGVARLISDGAMQGYINGVAVRRGYQGHGIGSTLVQMLIDTDPSLHFHLRTTTRRFTFYERLGFVRDDTGMERFPTRERAQT